MKRRLFIKYSSSSSEELTDNIDNKNKLQLPFILVIFTFRLWSGHPTQDPITQGKFEEEKEIYLCHSAEQKCQEQRNQQVVLSQKNIFPNKSVNGQNNHVGKIYGEKIIENVFVLKQNTVVCF